MHVGGGAAPRPEYADVAAAVVAAAAAAAAAAASRRRGAPAAAPPRCCSHGAGNARRCCCARWHDSAGRGWYPRPLRLLRLLVLLLLLLLLLLRRRRLLVLPGSLLPLAFALLPLGAQLLPALCARARRALHLQGSKLVSPFAATTRKTKTRKEQADRGASELEQGRIQPSPTFWSDDRSNEPEFFLLLPGCSSRARRR